MRNWFIICLAACAVLFAVPSVHGGDYRQMNDSAKVLHLLNRITYGATPVDIEHVQSVGIAAYISEQLYPEKLEADPAILQVAAKDSLVESPARLFLQYGPPTIAKLGAKGKQTVEGRTPVDNGNLARGAPVSSPLSRAAEEKTNQQKAAAQIRKKFYDEIYTARIMRATRNRAQLEELMVDFWFNHFNVSFEKGLDHLWVGSYEEQAIRPRVLGKFRDLLGATAHHAAMSFYLDNWQNSAPGSAGAGGKLKGLNENYARELLELHTLGVDGGYSQTDVIELARILTGFGFVRKQAALRNAGLIDSKAGTLFDASRHDFGDKVLLKHKIVGRGADELEEALGILASHPSTAKHIAYKLAQYFVADDPPAKLVQKLAAKFSSSDGDIRAVVSELLHSDEFWDKKFYGCKYKSPYRYLISTLRATRADLSEVRPTAVFLVQSGMPLYRCSTPDGYKNTRAAWLNPDGLIKRINFATALSVRHAANLEMTDYRQLLPLLGAQPSTATVQSIAGAPARLKLALILSSPEFMIY